MADSAPAYRDAEAWLAERGVAREPLRVDDRPTPVTDAPPVVEDADASRDGSPPSTDEAEAAGVAGAADHPGAENLVPVGADRRAGELGAREARRLLGQARMDAALLAADRDAGEAAASGLEDDVARAVAFVRRSTAGAPQTESRLRDKLVERGHPEQVVVLALERARRERLIDDAAMAAALVDEKRRAGHAPARIRQDLRRRGFGDALLDPLLAAAEAEDQEAAAFAVAAERAARLTATAPETAYRRVVAHVARRGYPEGLARKVARAAVFTTREQEHTAGR